MSSSAGESPFPDFDDLEDSELVFFALGENAREIEAARTKIYERYKKALYAYIARRLHDKQQVEDLVQTVFEKANASLGSLRDPSMLKQWLYRIADRVFLDHIRYENRHWPIHWFWNRHDENLEIENLVGTADTMELQVERRELIRRIFISVPYKNRAACILYYAYNFSHREIAERIGIQENSVSQCIKRGVEAARKRWKELSIDGMELEQ